MPLVPISVKASGFYPVLGARRPAYKTWGVPRNFWWSVPLASFTSFIFSVQFQIFPLKFSPLSTRNGKTANKFKFSLKCDVDKIDQNPYKNHKILIISPWLIFVQKAFLLGLFSDELIFGGAYYWREFPFQNSLGLTKKKTA